MLVAVRVGYVLCGIVCAQALDAQLVQGQQLALADFAVTVRVPPDLQGSKGRVIGIQHAIPVFIQLSQGRKAVGRLLAIFQQAVVAKEFRTVVYLSVAVPIPNQKSVIRRDPAGKLGKTVGVVVEEHTRILPQGLNTITVQIKYERRGGLFGLVPQPLQPIQQAVHKGIVRTLLRRVVQMRDRWFTIAVSGTGRSGIPRGKASLIIFAAIATVRSIVVLVIVAITLTRVRPLLRNVRLVTAFFIHLIFFKFSSRRCMFTGRPADSSIWCKFNIYIICYFVPLLLLTIPKSVDSRPIVTIFNDYCFFITFLILH